MNPIIKIVSGFLIIVNRTINNMDKKTATLIKQTFFLIIFIFMFIGAIVGYNMGKDAAQIKSPPLAGTTNQVFEIDISKEKKDGEFSSLLQNELVSEAKYSKEQKAKYPSRENLEPEMDIGIIELDNEKKVRPVPDTDSRDRLFEGKYRFDKPEESHVRPIDREIKSIEKKDKSIIIHKDEKGVNIQKGSSEKDSKTFSDKSDKKKKGKLFKIDKKDPQPIKNERDIFDK